MSSRIFMGEEVQSLACARRHTRGRHEYRQPQGTGKDREYPQTSFLTRVAQAQFQLLRAGPGGKSLPPITAGS